MNIKNFLDKYEHWHDLMIFSFTADMMSTMIGISIFGPNIEANPIVRYALLNNFYLFPILLGFLVILILNSVKNNWKKSNKIVWWMVSGMHALLSWGQWIFFLASY